MKTSIPVVYTLLLILGLLAGCGGSSQTPTVEVKRGRIEESFTEPARTRIEERWQVAMPVTADVFRIVPKPGDVVKKGELLLEIDRVPLQSAVDEAHAAVDRLRAELALRQDETVERAELDNARAAVEAVKSQLASAELSVAEWRLRADRLQKEDTRLRALLSGSAAAERELDDARLNAEASALTWQQAKAEVERLGAMSRSAEASVATIAARIERKALEAEVIRGQLRQAEAALLRAEHNFAISQVRSPIDGLILERYEIGGGPIMAGSRLFLIGSLEAMEVEADVLTQDAYLLKVGAVVEYSAASGTPALRGRVTRIEPAGFTKFSSLGVEQQRVLVISSLDERPAALGLGFRVLARYSKGAKDDALIIPRSAVLQDPDGTRYVFKVAGGRAVRVTIELGLRSDFEIEVVKGLAAGDVVVLAPDSTIQAGARL